MAERLTARRVETLKPPASGRTEITDTDARGLAFRITANGDRTWTLRGRVSGREVRYQLGNYPELSLADARAAAGELRARLRRGEDPRTEEENRKAALREEQIRKEVGSVGNVMKHYWDLHLCEKANAETWRRALEKALAPHMNSPMEELTTLELDAAVAGIRKSGKMVQANRVRSHLRTFTKWAYTKGLSSNDLGKGMAKKTEEYGRDRVLEMEELAAIWHAAKGPGGQAGNSDQRGQGQGPVWGPFIRFLLLTGQRFGDAAKMEWPHLSSSNWNQPSRTTKNGKPHVVHLTDAALQLLDSQVPVADAHKGLVFHSTSGNMLESSDRRLKKLRQQAGVQDFTLHDFRTAMATHLAGRGHPEGVVDRILNHAASVSQTSTVARAYQRNELLEQRKRALEDWSAIVLEAVNCNGCPKGDTGSNEQS